MRTIDIHDKPIALVIQIDPESHDVVEIVLKTEYVIEGHTGVRDLWFQGTTLEDRTNARAVVERAIEELLNA